MSALTLLYSANIKSITRQIWGIWKLRPAYIVIFQIHGQTKWMSHQQNYEQWRSLLRQFARARKIDEYDLRMSVPYVRPAYIVIFQIHGQTKWMSHQQNYEQWRSLLCQFARARKIDEYDLRMPVPYVCMTSQINSGDVTILSQKRPSLATMLKSGIDDCF